MMTNPTSVLTLTTRAAEKVGAKFDKATAAALADLDALAGKVRSFERPATDLPGVVVAALAAGKDPLTDPNVAREITRVTIAAQHIGLSNALTERAHDVLNAHAADMLEAFRAPFEEAADAISDARNLLGDVSLNDTHTIITKGGNAASVWANAKTADDKISRILQAIAVLASSVHSLHYEPQYRLLVIADIPAATFLDDGLTGKDLSAWDACRAGYVLDLADADAMRERVDRLTHERQTRETARQESQSIAAGWRRTHGVIIGG